MYFCDGPLIFDFIQDISYGAGQIFLRKELVVIPFFISRTVDDGLLHLLAA